MWFLVSIGNAYFLQKKYTEAFGYFDDARCNLTGEGYNNPFVMLRLGQVLYEMQDYNNAKEYLLRAYMSEGKEIFEEDDEKYIEFLKRNIKL